MIATIITLTGVAITLAGTAYAWYMNTQTENLRKENKFMASEKRAEETEQDVINRTSLDEVYTRFVKEASRLKEDALKNRNRFMQIAKQLKKQGISYEKKGDELLQQSGYREVQLAKTLYRVDYTINRLNAYLDQYVPKYERTMNSLYQQGDKEALINLDLIYEQLPDGFFFEGQLVLFNRNEFSGRGFNSTTGERLILDDPDRMVQIPSEEIPVLVRKKGRDKTFLGAISKGNLMHNLVKDPHSPVDVEVIFEHKSNREVYCSYGHEKYDTAVLPKANKEVFMKPYYEGLDLQVFVERHDPTFRNVLVSERKVVEKDIDFNFVLPLCTSAEVLADRDLMNKIEKAINSETPELFVFKNRDHAADVADMNLKLGSKLFLELTLSGIDNHEGEGKIPYFKIAGEMENAPDFEDYVGTVIPSNLGLIEHDTIPDVSAFPGLLRNTSNFLIHIEHQLKREMLSENEKETMKFFRRWQSYIQNRLDEDRYSNLATCASNDLLVLDDGINFSLLLSSSESRSFRNNVDEEELRHVKILYGGEEAGSLISFELLDGGRIQLDGKLYVPWNEIAGENKTENKAITIAKAESDVAFKRQRDALKSFSRLEVVNEKVKDAFLQPELVIPPNEIPRLDLVNERLTASQRTAVETATANNSLHLIQGPPGTGKTTVIVELVLQQLKKDPHSSILITSQQNVAVDNALEGILKNGEGLVIADRVTRIAGNHLKTSDDIKKILLDKYIKRYQAQVSLHHEQHYPEDRLAQMWQEEINVASAEQMDGDILSTLLGEQQILGATCVGLGNEKKGVSFMEFDLVIVDEAGRATPPEILIPLNRAKKAVIIGDHYQLPPFVYSDDSGKTGLLDGDARIFERLYNRLPNGCKTLLQTQFRMPENLGNFVSKTYYEGMLENGMKDSERINRSDSSKEVSWVNVIGRQKRNKSNSLYNVREAQYIVNMLAKKLENWGSEGKNIAVITPYSAQKNEIIRLFCKQSDERYLSSGIVKINTIDAFQGQEAEIVIYSCTRTKGNLNFLLDRFRLNVALSRVKEQLIMVGNRDHILGKKDPNKTGNEPNTFTELAEYFKL